jgi:fermentation-respiration switch protein FrsA (DUF1100 family)
MRLLHCTWAILLLLPAPAAAQQPFVVAQGAPSSVEGQPAGSAARAGYTVFLRGTPIGREEVTVQQDVTGLTITSTSRLGTPFNVVVRSAQVKYRADWTPEQLTVDADVQGADVSLTTHLADGTAESALVVRGQKTSAIQVTPRSPFLLPGNVFGVYEAVSRRLAASNAATDQTAFLWPEQVAAFQISASGSEQMQTGTTTFAVRRYALTFTSTGPPFIVNLWADAGGALLRLNVPSQGLDVVRDDLASTATRLIAYANPGDEAVVIPAAGFNLGATMTRPGANTPRPANGRYPAVVLVGGAAVTDRDGVVAGVPILGQLAGALAETGFIAVRFDKRGSGQSGGRTESTTLSDLADDTRAVVRWLASRNDVDRDRIGVLGHSEGAWVALLTAAREGRVHAVVSIAAASTTGSELVLEQQRQALAQLNTPDAERAAKIALQERINAAAMSGRGWEGIDPEVRRQADTPWFQSLLQFNPAEALEDIDEPVLFVHGQLDMQVPVAHAEQIADLARTRSDSPAVALVTVRGVNHLLAPATTGQVSEYATLMDRNVSKDVTDAVTSWLQKTFAARR